MCPPRGACCHRSWPSSFSACPPICDRSGPRISLLSAPIRAVRMVPLRGSAHSFAMPVIGLLARYGRPIRRARGRWLRGRRRCEGVRMPAARAPGSISASLRPSPFGSWRLRRNDPFRRAGFACPLAGGPADRAFFSGAGRVGDAAARIASRRGSIITHRATFASIAGIPELERGHEGCLRKLR